MISVKYLLFLCSRKGAWVPSESGVCAGLAPLVALAARAGLGRAGHTPRVSGDQGANPRVEVPALVAGIVAGANSINDMDLLRRGGMGRLFSGVRAPSTLGICLRAFTFGTCPSA
jgi:hypothetical protein